MINAIMHDAKAIAKRDPAAKGLLEVILLYPGFHAVLFHKMAHWLYLKRFYFTARMVSQISRFLTGIEIHPGAKIGRGLFIDHGMGIVIGETAEIGDNCTIYHGVTLGGTGREKGKRHPVIGNNVLISSGAKVLGPLTVGDNSRIGANAVVLDNVEAYSTVVGVPGRVVRIKGRRVVPSIELDQIHLTDPVAQEFERIRVRIDIIEKKFMQKDDSL